MIARTSSIERFRLVRPTPTPLEWTERIGTQDDGWGKVDEVVHVADHGDFHILVHRGNIGCIVEVRQVVPHGSRLLRGGFDGIEVPAARTIAEAVVAMLDHDPHLCPQGCHHRTGWMGTETATGDPVVVWTGWDGANRTSREPTLCLRSRAVLWPDGSITPVTDGWDRTPHAVEHLATLETRST